MHLQKNVSRGEQLLMYEKPHLSMWMCKIGVKQLKHFWSYVFDPVGGLEEHQLYLTINWHLESLKTSHFSIYEVNEIYSNIYEWVATQLSIKNINNSAERKNFTFSMALINKLGCYKLGHKEFQKEGKNLAKLNRTSEHWYLLLHNFSKYSFSQRNSR